MHPHLSDLSNLSDNELESRVIDLQRKYWQTPNEGVKQQIVLLLDDYKLELESRRAKQKLADEQKMQDGGESGLDNLINVS